VNEGVFYVNAARLLPTEELTKPGGGYDTEKAVEEKIQQIQQGQLEPIEVCHQKPVNTYRLADKPMEKSGQAEPFYYVLNGHHRLEAINRLGIQKVPIYLTQSELTEDKAPLLEEGVKDWWMALMGDLAAVQAGLKPTQTIGTMAQRIEDTEHVKNLKGNDLAKCLGTTLTVVNAELNKILKKNPGGADQEVLKKLKQQARAVNNLIVYAKTYDTETYAAMLQNASMAGDRSPEERKLATNLTMVTGFLGTVARLVAPPSPEMIGDVSPMIGEEEKFQKNMKKQLPAELDFLLKKGGNNTKVGPGVKNPKKPKFKSAPPGTAPVGEGAED